MSVKIVSSNDDGLVLEVSIPFETTMLNGINSAFVVEQMVALISFRSSRLVLRIFIFINSWVSKASAAPFFYWQVK